MKTGENAMEELNSGYNKQVKLHKITMVSRKNCTVTGVSDVLSFDVSEVLLETEQGMLMIKGKDLHVNRLSLDKGEVDVEGLVDSLTYSEVVSTKDKAQGFFSKLFA